METEKNGIIRESNQERSKKHGNVETNRWWTVMIGISSCLRSQVRPQNCHCVRLQCNSSVVRFYKIKITQKSDQYFCVTAIASLFVLLFLGFRWATGTTVDPVRFMAFIYGGQMTATRADLILTCTDLFAQQGNSRKFTLAIIGLKHSPYKGKAENNQ